MYVQQTAACNLPNSETPMSADAIARQDAFVAGVGKKFTDGNNTMAGVIAMLTPPPPVGSCDDFTSSLSMYNITPFPWPIPGAAGVNANAPSLSGGAAAPAGSSAAPADAFAQLSNGWQWANKGGGSTYPWGQTQLRASRLIPPWICTPVPANGMLDGSPSDMATAMTWAKWLAGGAAVALVIAASRKGKNR